VEILYQSLRQQVSPAYSEEGTAKQLENGSD
jgi:hypothetical protein